MDSTSKHQYHEKIFPSYSCGIQHGCDEQVVDGVNYEITSETQKVLRNGQLLIERNGCVCITR